MCESDALPFLPQLKGEETKPHVIKSLHPGTTCAQSILGFTQLAQCLVEYKHSLCFSL